MIQTEDIICRVEEISYSNDQSEFTVEEEAYYNLLAHILEYRDQASTDEMQEEEEETPIPKKRPRPGKVKEHSKILYNTTTTSQNDVFKI